MKRLIPITLIFFAFWACKNDPSSSTTNDNNNNPGDTSAFTNIKITNPSDENKVPNQPTERDASGLYEKHTALDISGRPQEVYRPVVAVSSVLSVNPIQKIDPNKPVVKKIVAKTPEEKKVLEALTKNYWVIWGVVRINRKENKANQGGYYKFKEDGTFEFGQWGKKICNGAWSFDASKNTIFIDSELLGDDREWTYDLNSYSEAMVWIGTPRFFLTDVQIKLDNYYNIPKTRAEAAVPDFE